MNDKTVVWVGTALDDVSTFPLEVKRKIGKALRQVQQGEFPPQAKPLAGFHGAMVQEIVADFNTDTYRAVYTVQFVDAIYVLHCFQKKAKQGRATPRPDMKLIRERLRSVIEDHTK